MIDTWESVCLQVVIKPPGEGCKARYAGLNDLGGSRHLKDGEVREDLNPSSVASQWWCCWQFLKRAPSAELQTCKS